MNEILAYMQRSESALADFESRLSAMEKLVKNLPGLAMESDPSKLPVIVTDNSTPPVEVIGHAGN